MASHAGIARGLNEFFPISAGMLAHWNLKFEGEAFQKDVLVENAKRILLAMCEKHKIDEKLSSLASEREEKRTAK